MDKQIITTENAPKAIGPYSQGIFVSAKKLYYFSGQIAINPVTSAFIGGSAFQQTEQILTNIEALLKSQNLTAENIIKTTVFLTNMSDFKDVNELYSKFIGSFPPPARSCVAVLALPLNAQVEIEVIAAE